MGASWTLGLDFLTSKTSDTNDEDAMTFMTYSITEV